MGIPPFLRRLPRLAAIATDSKTPGMIRATAIDLLSRLASPVGAKVVQRSVADKDPLVRYAAARSLDVIAPDHRLKVGAPLLTDSVRGVRIEAAVRLAGASGGPTEPLSRAITEYEETQRQAADRPSALAVAGVGG